MALSVRVVRKLVLLVFLVVLAYVGWLLWGMKRRPSSAVVEKRATEPMPATPQEEMGCFDDLVLDWSGDRLEAGRACKQPDGFSQLQRVTLRLRKEDGTEQMVVRAKNGRTSDAAAQVIELTGDVHVETPQGLKLDSQMLLVDKAASEVRSDRPVTFTQGDLAGEGGRLVHDWKNGTTLLEDSPQLILSGEKTRGRKVTLVGQRLHYDQKGRMLTAMGAALLEFPEGSVEGSSIEVELAEAAEEVRSITSTGAAATKTVIAGAGPGGVPGPPVERVLRASRIVHEFAAAGALDRVTAEGDARLDGHSVDASLGITELLEGVKLDLDFQGSQVITLGGLKASGAPAKFRRDEPGSTREITGNELELKSGSEGFESLVVTGGADVRDHVGALMRTLRADAATIGFAPGGMALKSLRFDGKPGRLAETTTGAGLPRTIVARQGDLTFDSAGHPVSGTLDGDVEILDAGTRASADHARLQENPSRTVLQGNAAVEREGRTSHGDEIVSEGERGKSLMTVTGNQHTLVREASTMPGMASGGSDEPVLISSDTLVLDERRRTALYEGGRPSLRRGDTELVADRLELDDAAGSMDAFGSVTSRLRLAKPGTAAQASESPFDPTRLVDGKADEFHYRRTERLVTYLGAASLKQEDTLLTSDRVDIRLTASEPAQVESLEASGSCFFRAPTRGEAEGDRLRWKASDDSFRVYGGARPARAIDANGTFQTGSVIELTREGGVRALASPTGRARGSSPALQAPATKAPATNAPATNAPAPKAPAPSAPAPKAPAPKALAP